MVSKPVPHSFMALEVRWRLCSTTCNWRDWKKSPSQWHSRWMLSSTATWYGWVPLKHRQQQTVWISATVLEITNLLLLRNWQQYQTCKPYIGLVNSKESNHTCCLVERVIKKNATELQFYCSSHANIAARGGWLFARQNDTPHCILLQWGSVGFTGLNHQRGGIRPPPTQCVNCALKAEPPHISKGLNISFAKSTIGPTLSISLTSSLVSHSGSHKKYKEVGQGSSLKPLSKDLHAWLTALNLLRWSYLVFKSGKLLTQVLHHMHTMN